MTKSPGARGNDLAADLLADLAAPPSSDRQPVSPNSATAPDPLSSPPSGDADGRGPALEGFLRISPLTWRKPRVVIGSQSATIGFGPVRAQLGIHV